MNSHYRNDRNVYKFILTLLPPMDLESRFDSGIICDGDHISIFNVSHLDVLISLGENDCIRPDPTLDGLTDQTRSLLYGLTLDELTETMKNRPTSASPDPTGIH